MCSSDLDVPEHEQLAGLVFELLGHVLADPGLVAAAVAGPLLLGDVMENLRARQVLGNRLAAVPLASRAGR